MWFEKEVLRLSVPARRLSARNTRGSSTTRQLDGLTIRSPKDLYNHLSDYIIGQDRAKRILSVAVFNHYHRISSRLPQTLPPPPPPLRSNEYHADPGPSKGMWERPYDPSRAGSDMDDGVRRDVTRVTGTGNGADPTLTHDLLSSTSREGLWSRNGYFSSKPPPPPILLDKTRRRRRDTPDPMLETTSVERKGKKKDILSDIYSSLNNIEADKLEDGKEEIAIEKSNVLMIGPTGTGKTLMARTLARILDVPFASTDATSYTQAGYVGDDVENCVLRLLQAADYDVNRTEIGIIHIDEIDKLARRGGGEAGSWGARDVGGEGVQQALLRLLEGTILTLSAKPQAMVTSGYTSTSSSSTPSTRDTPNRGPRADGSTLINAAYEPPGWDPNNPMNRSTTGGKKGVREGLPGFSGGSGLGGGSKGDTFMVDTSNILFILSGAFVGLESIVSSRLGKGSMGFGAPLPASPATPRSTVAMKGLATTDLATYGLIPEFLGRLPVLSTLHPLSVADMVRILVEPRNALIKQYIAMFEKYGSELRFTHNALEVIAKEGLERGGGARGLRGVLEELLVDAMFEVPGSSVRYCLITGPVARREEPALYFSRGQKHLFSQAAEQDDKPIVSSGTHVGEVDDEVEEVPKLRAVG